MESSRVFGWDEGGFLGHFFREERTVGIHGRLGVKAVLQTGRQSEKCMVGRQLGLQPGSAWFRFLRNSRAKLLGRVLCLLIKNGLPLAPIDSPLVSC